MCHPTSSASPWVIVRSSCAFETKTTLSYAGSTCISISASYVFICRTLSRINRHKFAVYFCILVIILWLKLTNRLQSSSQPLISKIGLLAGRYFPHSFSMLLPL